jgi:hypothetical protein
LGQRFLTGRVTAGQEFLKGGSWKVGSVPLIKLLDARAFGAVLLFQATAPRLDDLLRHDGMVQPAVAAFVPAAQGLFAVLSPRLKVAAQADQAAQDGVVVRERSGRELMPSPAP